MAAVQARFVLFVSLAACAAALTVALVAGNISEASGPAASGPERTALLAPPSGTGDVPSLRSEFARSYRQTDGSTRTLVSAVPLNYRGPSGTWQPIDTTLRSDGSGGVESHAAPVQVSLPHDLGDPVRVAQGSDWVNFTLRNASPGAAVAAKGSSASYANALDGVDVDYVAQAFGVKETVTLTERSAPSDLRFALDASNGLTPVLRDDGSLALRDEDGRAQFVLPAPTVQQAGADQPTTRHVAYELSADKTTLTVAVDPDWLAGAQLPVRVDPTVYDGASVTACNLASGSSATTSDCASGLLKVGYDGSHVQRAALRFGGLAADGIPIGAAIDYAQLGLTFESMTNTSAQPQIDVAALGSTVGAGATWNTYDATNAWPTAGGDVDTGAAQVQPLPFGANFLGDAGEPLGWDVSGLVQSWLRNPTTNHGVRIKAHDETVNNTMSFDSPTGTAQGPFLSIDWRSRPGSERDQTYEGVGISDRSGLAVNVVSGNASVTGSDVHLPGVAGLDLDVARTYNTGDFADQHFAGSAWTTTVNGASLNLETHFLSGGRTLYANGGAIYRFDRDTTADTTPAGGPLMYGYTTPAGIDATMQQNSVTGATTVTFRNGTVWTYSGGDFYEQVLTQIKDRHNNHIDLTYDSAWGSDEHALKAITDTYGRDLTVTRALPSGTITGLTDSSGRHWTWNTNSADHLNLASAKDPDNHQVSYTYDTTVSGVSDRLKTITDARNHDIRITYDPANAARVATITRVIDGTTANDIRWSYNYSPASGTGDACTATGAVGRTVETDPEGHVTTYCYNNNGQVIQVFDANHRSTTSTYTAQANVATFTGLAGTANPSLSTYSFNANGSATGSSTRVGTNTESTTINYCGTGTQPSCSSTAYSQYKYLPTASSDTQGTQQAFGYNATGDLTDVTTPSGSDHQQLHYTGAGEVDWSKDGNGNQTSYDWTTVSHFLSRVTLPAPLVAENFGADSIDRVAWAEDGNRVFSCVTYDGEDRTTRVDYKTGSCTGTSVGWMTFTYDAAGNLTQRADSAGNTTIYGYDYANRRTSETFPSSRTNTYSYDRSSNLASLVDNDGTTSYTYDPANRLRTVTSPRPGGGTDAITYGYTDPAASTDPSTETITFPGGLRQVSTVDAAGNVLSIKATTSSGTVLDKRDYSYLHTVGSTTSVSEMIQTMTDSAGNTTTYNYGSANRLAGAVTANGGTPTEQWIYNYDPAGNRTSWRHLTTSGNVGATYTYNSANELCWFYGGPSRNACASPPTGAVTYAYDNDGQRTTNPTAAYDNLQRLTTLAGTALSYLSPGNGELVSYGTTGYQNNLLGVGRVIPSSGTATDLIRTPNGATIAQRGGTTSKQDLFTDALGSTFATADDNATTLAKRYTYDPDGNATGTGTGATPTTLYAGGIQIGGLYHYGARYYDPATASWTQPDPINQISSLSEANHYAYAGGNPIVGSDKTGKATAGGHCIEGSPGFSRAACERAGFKITTRAQWEQDEKGGVDSSSACAGAGIATGLALIPTPVTEAASVIIAGGTAYGCEKASG